MSQAPARGRRQQPAAQSSCRRNSPSHQPCSPSSTSTPSAASASVTGRPSAPGLRCNQHSSSALHRRTPAPGVTVMAISLAGWPSRRHRLDRLRRPQPSAGSLRLDQELLQLLTARLGITTSGLRWYRPQSFSARASCPASARASGPATRPAARLTSGGQGAGWCARPARAAQAAVVAGLQHSMAASHGHVSPVPRTTRSHDTERYPLLCRSAAVLHRLGAHHRRRPGRARGDVSTSADRASYGRHPGSAGLVPGRIDSGPPPVRAVGPRHLVSARSVIRRRQPPPAPVLVGASSGARATRRLAGPLQATPVM